MREKAKHLVCQYLEYVSNEIFKKYQPIIKEYIKGRQGIYALYKKEKLVYVGLATNMISRLKTHNVRDRHAGRWDRFSIYLTATDSHLKELESLLLRVASPKSNKQSGKLGKAENIERKLKRNIKEFQNKELNYLLQGKKKASEELAEEVVSGRVSTIAKYVKKRFKIRLIYKGKTYEAKVLANGKIRYKGKLYTSPSEPATKIRGNNTDGWHEWKYQRSNGDWVKLNELRNKN
jgi:hypothetical protein